MPQSQGKGAKKKPAQDRRRSQRRPIVEAFNVFVVLPSKGAHRLKIHDVSDHGVGFDIDMEGEPLGDYELAKGDVISVELHFNTRLSIPLKLKVTRVEVLGGLRRVGGELVDRKAPEHQAFDAFVRLVDALISTGRFKV